jgi:hypothetical protein
MKIEIWIGLLILIATPVTLYLVQRWRTNRAEREGVVLYATVTSLAPVKVFGKQSEMVKISMWIQEPEKPGREVSIRSRIAEGQQIEPGVKLCVVVDPKNPKRVYPASEAAQKRVVYTGSRAERRMMKSGRGVARPRGRKGAA